MRYQITIRIIIIGPGRGTNFLKTIRIKDLINPFPHSQATTFMLPLNLVQTA